jgi:hypothetical protein
MLLLCWWDNGGRSVFEHYEGMTMMHLVVHAMNRRCLCGRVAFFVFVVIRRIGVYERSGFRGRGVGSDMCEAH